MTGRSSVLAIEARERMYYAPAANIAISTCFNAVALKVVVTDKLGIRYCRT
jgi:hypothetical protein